MSVNSKVSKTLCKKQNSSSSSKQEISLLDFDGLLLNSSSQSNCEKNRKNGRYFPAQLRCLIIGPSACGKTSLLLSLIVNENALTFENVYVFSRSLHQPKYRLLEMIFNGLKNIGLFMSGDIDNIPPPEKLRRNSLVIFDDIIFEGRSKITSYFCIGRHYNLDCVYLVQSFAAAGKHNLRDNVNYIILFRTDLQNLKLIFRDYVASDMSFSAFHKMCDSVWRSNKRAFITINLELTPQSGKYKNGFEREIIIS